MNNYRRLSLTVGAIVCFIVLFSRCLQSGPAESGDPRGPAYAGMAACLGCHKDVGNSYLHAAHALTSRVADDHTVLGPFTPPGNEFIYGPGRKVVLEQRDSGLFQVAITSHGQEAHRFDIAIGSGRKAQTYLYWKGDAVYQLPVSYFLTEHSWANSPHYPADSIWFGRVVEVGCFECHSSYIRTKPMIHTDAFHGIPQFDRAHLVYGIDCERCHGPGAKHAAWQLAHPEDKQAKIYRNECFADPATAAGCMRGLSFRRPWRPAAFRVPIPPRRYAVKFLFRGSTFQQGPRQYGCARESIWVAGCQQMLLAVNDPRMRKLS